MLPPGPADKELRSINESIGAFNSQVCTNRWSVVPVLGISRVFTKPVVSLSVCPGGVIVSNCTIQHFPE